LSSWYSAAIDSAGIVPVGDPQLDLGALPPDGEGLEFSIEIGVVPKAELGSFDELEVPRREPVVEDELIEREIELIRERLARLEAAARPAAGGGCLVVDYRGPRAPGGARAGAGRGRVPPGRARCGGGPGPGRRDARAGQGQGARDVGANAARVVAPRHLARGLCADLGAQRAPDAGRPGARGRAGVAPGGGA